MKILFWTNFVLLVIVPIDLICPASVMRYICDTLQLNIYAYLATWLYMIYVTFLKNDKSRTDKRIGTA